ncbi:hypothetical protein [Paraburkholderia caballeronis]|uniref:hypothetical protein n=1 Tax=Paraburkholderia caballeronis TaxID=416943 RepID=UPI001065235D|nr:hypothetical protein [Paraburkholderia caballeronis]
MTAWPPHQREIGVIFQNHARFNVRPNSSQSLDGKRHARPRLSGKHRPMRLGLANYAPARRLRLAEAFVQRRRACISDQYIPGMSAGNYFGLRHTQCNAFRRGAETRFPATHRRA